VKLVRLAVAAALGASALVTVQAGAAPKLPCKLVTDASGDSFSVGSEDLDPVPASTPGAGPTSNVLDITSADVATDKKRITGVVRVVKLAASDPTFSPTGLAWRVNFTADGQAFSLIAQSDPTGALTYQASYRDKTTGGGNLYAGGVTGILDVAKSEIRMTAELGLFAAQATIKPGTKITEVGAGSGRVVAVPDAAKLFGGGSLLSYSPGVDAATSTKTYVASSKNCVLVGK